MKTLELFCGTKSFSKVAKEFGYETKTLDNDNQFNADLTMDIMDFDVSMLGDYKPDVIWASPPCQKFSVASFSTHCNILSLSYVDIVSYKSLVLYYQD